MQHEVHDHDRGLAFDLGMLRRRRVLAMIGGTGVVALAGCGGGEADTPAESAPSAAPSSAGCAEIPQETAGPYPGDGSNGPNVLAVYLWHCDRDGGYSLYSQGITGENYLRGVQEADASGVLSFTSVFPGAYSGRWPHVHFEVYPSLAKATASGNKITTSQLALPESACKTVYATAGYSASAGNLARSSLGSDNVFRDGYAQQLATVTGSASAGYVASLVVTV